MKARTYSVKSLQPHPRNYNAHPGDQIEQIAKSLEQHGQYKNVVIANDKTILAGHGLVLAAQHLEWEKITAVRLDVDPESPQALKILAADNTLATFSMVNDRGLTDLLQEVRELDEWALDGTGFDDMMLANLIMVTRPAHEIQDTDHAAEWLGMPDYEPKETDRRYTVLFATDKDRRAFAEKAGLRVGDDEKKTWSTWYPDKQKDDVKSVIVDA